MLLRASGVYAATPGKTYTTAFAAAATAAAASSSPAVPASTTAPPINALKEHDRRLTPQLVRTGGIKGGFQPKRMGRLQRLQRQQRKEA